MKRKFHDNYQQLADIKLIFAISRTHNRLMGRTNNQQTAFKVLNVQINLITGVCVSGDMPYGHMLETWYIHFVKIKALAELSIGLFWQQPKDNLCQYVSFRENFNILSVQTKFLTVSRL